MGFDEAVSGDGDPARGAFLDDLRAFESGIHLDRHDWYVAHLDLPVMQYPKVHEPGRVVRDPDTGLHGLVTVTVAEYFSALGVDRLFDERDPLCLRKMQYNAMNPWGYVGYQFGEECLCDVGYYEFERCTVATESGALEISRFHRGGMDPQTWTHGRTEVLLADEGIVATDVNRWRGRFTGKNGVSAFADLLEPESQEAIIREAASSNLLQLLASLDEADLALDDCLAREWVWKGRPVRCSVSGLIACCHLLGPQATARFFRSSELAQDALGTGLLDYMARFGHYPMHELPDLPAAFRPYR